jgi:hypothetical protein
MGHGSPVLFWENELQFRGFLLVALPVNDSDSFTP